MPALQVSVDGKPVTTVDTHGLNVLTVSVGGTKVDEPFASLGVRGGSYPDEGPSTHLIWVNEIPLKQGQVVSVSLLTSSSTSNEGKTIEELFPDEPPEETEAARELNEIFNELREMPRLRDSFAFSFTTSQGGSYVGSAPSSAHGFSLSVIWNWLHPERVSASLHTYTLDDLQERKSLNYLASEFIPVGQSVHLELVA